MKIIGLILALSLTTSLGAQESPPAAPPPPTPTPSDPILKTTSESVAKPSAQLMETLTSILPKYSPPPPPQPEKPIDPDVLVLEKKVVTPKKRPRLGDEELMKNKAFNDELAKKFTTPLDRVLNKFSLGGQSAAERAREEHEYKQRQELLQDVDTLARAIEVSDATQAKALRDAAAKR